MKKNSYGLMISLASVLGLCGCVSVAVAPLPSTNANEHVNLINGVAVVHVYAGSADAYFTLEKTGDPDINLEALYANDGSPVTNGKFDGGTSFKFFLAVARNPNSGGGGARVMYISKRQVQFLTVEGKTISNVPVKKFHGVKPILDTTDGITPIDVYLDTYSDMERTLYPAVLPSITSWRWDGCGFATKGYTQISNANVIVCSTTIRWMQGALTNFDDTSKKYEALIRFATVVPNEIKVGDQAAAAGALREAFEDYMRANDNLPLDAGSVEQDLAFPLWEKIAAVAEQLTPPPAIPQDAVKHSIYAQAAAERAKNAADLVNSEQEWLAAIKIAPWWADAYFNLAAVAAKAGNAGLAVNALQLYLVAKPNASNAHDVQLEIYKLQYDASHPESNSGG